MDSQIQLSMNKSLKDGTFILKLRAKKRRTGVLEGDFWKKDETELSPVQPTIQVPGFVPDPEGAGGRVPGEQSL